MPFDHFEFIAHLYHRHSDYSSLVTMLEVADLPTEGRLLDIGGGTGRVASALRDYAKQVIVADPSFGMLRFAASKPGLQAAMVVSEHLPFPDDFFQRVVMVDALHHVTNQSRTALELLRVLKPGGRIVIEEPDIRTIGAKLIALVEKILLMRSHFLSGNQIAYLFSPGKVQLSTKGMNLWVVIKK